MTIASLIRAEGAMPRYYFHRKSPSRPVRDKTGVEHSGFEAAHWHAMRLAYRLRQHAVWRRAARGVLQSAVPMLSEPASPPDGRAEYEPLLLHGVVRP